MEDTHVSEWGLGSAVPSLSGQEGSRTQAGSSAMPFGASTRGPFLPSAMMLNVVTKDYCLLGDKKVKLPYNYVPPV